MRVPCHVPRALAVVLVLRLISAGTLKAADCNRNGIEDVEEISGGASRDCNKNSIPDACDLRTSIRFRMAESYPVGQVPMKVIARDLNGDGFEDLLAGNISSDTISILLNDGGITFNPGVTISLDSDPTAIVAEDFTGDGLVDIGTYSERSYRILLFPANRRGTYQAPVEVHRFSGGSDLGDMIAADLDGDRDPDLAITGGGLIAGYTVSVFLNQGGGSFSGPLSYPCGPLSMALASFDLDRDGDLDLAAASFGDSKVTVLRNNGAGQFAAGVDEPVGREPVGLVAGDLDGDGFADLAVANQKDGNLSLLFNRQDGTFRDEDLPLGGPVPFSVSMGDLDGDGDQDLLVVTGSSILILMNRGDGSFSSPETLTPGPKPGSIAAVDLDGDGDVDIAVSDWHGHKVNVLRNAGNGKFPQPISQDLGPGPVHSGDWDGDGDQDLAVLTGQGVSFLWREGGVLVKGSLKVGTGGTHSVTADLDQDGRPDLAVISYVNSPPYIGRLEVVFNRGAEEFEAAGQFDLDPVPARIAAADLDRDGDLDLAVTSGRNRSVMLVTNLGERKFRREDSFRSDYEPIGLALADLTGDGKVDLATAERVGGGLGLIRIRPGRGDGTFSDSKLLDAGQEPQDLRAVDLDGDGDLDLVTVNRQSSDASVILQDTDGSFLRQQRYPVANGPQGIAVLDVDLDGDPDLAVACLEVSTVDLLVNDGKGAFTGGPPLSIGSAPQFVETVDFNGDRLPDLVASGSRGGTANAGLLFLIPNMTAPPASRDCNHNAVPDSCDIAQETSRDEDGNGVPDECGTRTRFHRGDTTDDGTMDISDGILLLGYLFLGNSAPDCLETGDAGNNGELDISDAIYLFDFLFLGGPPPASPGPPGTPCGQDPDLPGSSRDVGCRAYLGCT